MIKYEIIDISEVPDEELINCFFYMNKEKQEKIKRYRDSLAQKLSIGGEWLVRKLLSDYSKISPYDIIISRDELGKPFTPDFQEIFFSISHSENFVAAVISDRQVGIDIEKLRFLSVKASKKICCDEEIYYIFGKNRADIDFDSKQPPDVIKRFLEIWTAKEAYYKCIGTGIKNPKALNILSCNANLMKFEEKDYLICIAEN
ncbi:MAG: 4'-phosphopantetheinyl transferase superfamily protein [Clostridia bacterium]|nr:4'-phosphopantetheinyl transferase superfamily protein [Clostridia bacterium]